MCASSGCWTIGARTPSTSSSTALCRGSAFSGRSSSSSVAVGPGTTPSMPGARTRPHVDRAAATRRPLSAALAQQEVPELAQNAVMVRRMADEPLHCLVEIPKGSRNKYQWDEELGGIKLARFLFSSVVYPTDYGFVPETRSPKGEALDAMVAVSEPTFPGCVIPVRAVAILRTEDERGQDDKLLCVPCDDPGWSHIEDLDDFPERMRVE